MPKRQLMKVIEAELGPNWQDRLQSFDPEPIASASIGQACLFPAFSRFARIQGLY